MIGNGKETLACIILCVVGLGFLTLGETMRPASRDWICLGVPVCYALDTALTDRAVRRQEVDPLALGVLELDVVGAITLFLSLFLESPHLPNIPRTWASSLFLGLFCTGAAFVLQAVQQKNTTPEHVGLIFTFEPVFASVIAFFLAGEILSPPQLFRHGADACKPSFDGSGLSGPEKEEKVKRSCRRRVRSRFAS